MDSSTNLYIPPAQECMTCGFCIPHCPTFKLTRDELQSPRGRIRLIDRLLAGGELNETETASLRSCLQCRNCESLCPSKMPYGQLLDLARTRLEKQRHFGIRLLELASTHRRIKRWTARILRHCQGTGLQARLGSWLAGTWQELHRLNRLLPPLQPQTPPAAEHPAAATRRGRVALFLGCIGEVTDREAIDAGIRVLNAAGFDVSVPPKQSCCGALARHSGCGDDAVRFAEGNLQAFDLPGIDAIITTASACGQTLREYDRADDLSATGSAKVDGFVSRVRDISEFLAERLASSPGLELRPLPERVAVHEPCSLRNPFGLQHHVYTLLEHIPELQAEPLAHNETCCGAAGTHLLTEPETATALTGPKIAALAEAGIRTVVTSNTGCALQLRAEAEAAGLELRVLHPVTLLANQLA